MHEPTNVGTAEKWEFHRCRCGLTLAVPPDRKTIYWLRARKPIKRLSSKAELAAALETHCRCAPAQPSQRTGTRDEHPGR
jgi:hypothetical protein